MITPPTLSQASGWLVCNFASSLSQPIRLTRKELKQDVHEKL
ncbi:hypothetical protein MtrunA17_Chr6g0458461 [Medicago truncatula]|uniref:Uncharacterized protein n=1 Tax=Medicago truncatula TaxID=3880 RepID=A0A396HB33_MEDTR|nr:hypothetical protein MtrunA17_Chr6g0458461 [Medicago truncatula]